MLLRRQEMPCGEAIERLVGMQAQNPLSPYFGLWARLDGFRPEEMAGAITGRTAVRMPLLRSTIHLVTARDCLALRPVLNPVLERNLYVGSPYGRQIAGMDIEALLAAGRELLEERPRTSAELGKVLAELWPGRDEGAMAYALHNLVPVVQVPPRGVWGAGGLARWTTVEAWLGRPIEADPAPDEMVLRYLASFGPATVGDIRAWSGMAGLSDVAARLRPRLRTLGDEVGRELFDLPNAPLPEPDTPAPPRFLPDYDNALLAHADRTRIIAEEHRKRLMAGNDAPGTVLLDGFVAETWKISRSRDSATLLIRPLEPLQPRDRAALADEGARPLSFASASAKARDVQFTPPE